MKRWFFPKSCLRGSNSSIRSPIQPYPQETEMDVPESSNRDVAGVSQILKSIDQRFEALEKRMIVLEKNINDRFDEILKLLYEHRPASSSMPPSYPSAPTVVTPTEIAKEKHPRDLKSESQEMRNTMMVSSQSGHNIIVNHDFSGGLESWHANGCRAYVACGDSGHLNGATENSGKTYAVVTERTESWQGLEQDITRNVTLNTTYTVSAFVRVSGNSQGPSNVQATLKLEYPHSPTNYLFVGRAMVSNEPWEMLEGTFSLTSMPERAIFYLEGPSPGIDLLIDSVTVSCSGLKQFEVLNGRDITGGDENIIKNPHFAEGLNNWSGKGCQILLHNSSADGKIRPVKGNCFVSATSRSQSWNGIQQDITGRVQRKLAYEVTALVRTGGTANNAIIRVSLWVQAPNGREQYIGIANLQAGSDEWVQLQGKFILNGIASKVFIYLEGPPPGTDILVDSLDVRLAKKAPPSPPPDFEGYGGGFGDLRINTNIVCNHDFSKGLHCWSLNSCDGYVASTDSGLVKGITAKTGGSYAVITNRTETWQGLEQDITKYVQSDSTYNVLAYVRVSGTHQEPATVIATVKLLYPDSPPNYVFVGRALVSTERWETLEGNFSLATIPEHVVFYLEGPSAGIDLLIDSVIVSPSSLKVHQNILFGVNIIENSTFNEGLNKWNPMGSCTLSVHSGGPKSLPPVARDSLIDPQPLSGRYLLTTKRTETWMGPSQAITEKLKLYLTYQLAAWVRVNSGAVGPQNVNIALNLDSNWVNGGQVEVNDDRWYEIAGSFRAEKKPSKVILYIQGPSPGVDLMIAGLHMFPVDRKARFEDLKRQTDKVRKRDIVLKFSGLDRRSGVPVKIKQIENSFPFGSCINRSNLDNEDFVDFFVNNFNWAVFGNELKWYHTESQQGDLNYQDADEMLAFCEKHQLQTRGHCIFWEVEDSVQPWVRSLHGNELMKALQNRLRGLLYRYRGRFKHYDVNNEMLHGSFFQDRLGKDIRAYMFREAYQLDPSAILFVNDYNVEDGQDAKSTPEKYINQILDLQQRGAPVGGIGLQGHIHRPVGPIVRAALDKLAILGLPIWFTELDVAAANEHVRADDLEVILREAYAHPAVEGIVMWGFWELFMWREQTHLVDADGSVNEAGKRFLALKQEWLCHADGSIDSNGEFGFRGFPGTYSIEVDTPWKKFSQSFVVDKGQSPLFLNINL